MSDLVYGDMKVKHITIDDQVLLKTDGYPTYHLANVVDDHLMEISHVMRGEVSWRLEDKGGRRERKRESEKRGDRERDRKKEDQQMLSIAIYYFALRLHSFSPSLPPSLFPFVPMMH